MAKKAKKMTAAVKAKLAAHKAAKKGGAKKGGAKKGGAKKAKGLSRSKASSLGHAAHGFDFQVPPKSASDAVRLSALEHNQRVLAGGLNGVAAKVMEHDRALVGAGLLKRRGAR